MATTKVIAKSDSFTKMTVEARGFKMVVDQPPSFGGQDEGPTPIEYMFAALAGCLNLLGNMIAREMAFELRGFTIELEGDLNPARLMGKSKEIRAGVDGIRVKIHPDSDAEPDVLREWIARIEDRCPVTDNLVNGTPISFVVF